MTNGVDEQNGGNYFKGRTLSFRQKMILGVVGPIVVLMLGWVGTWVGSTVTQGANANTRLSVVETKVSTLESQRAELLSTVKEISSDVKTLNEKIDNLPLLAARIPDLPQRIVHIERTLNQLLAEQHPSNISRSDRARDDATPPIVCDPPSMWVRAANGEWFCRRR